MVKNKTENGQRPHLFDLFLAFLRLGLTAFGGPAMIAYIKELVVWKYKWSEESVFEQGLALCQTLPGPMVVNTASYLGLRLKGIPGMLACFTGFLLPSALMMFAFSGLYYKSYHMPVLTSVFNGLQVIVVVIIIKATSSWGRETLKTRRDVLLALITTLVLLGKINPFFVIMGAALAGIIYYDRGGSEAASPQLGTAGYGRAALLLFVFFVVFILLLFWFHKNLFDLALVMTKIALFSFGGGYGALPLMFHEVVETRGWLDSKTFLDGVALGQVTPGPILINATFVGYLREGVLGSLVGTLAVFFPGLILVAATTPVFDRLKSSRYFLRATRGIKTSFFGLFLFMAIKFALAIPWNLTKFVLAAAALAALVKKIDLLYVVLIGTALSALLF